MRTWLGAFLVPLLLQSSADAGRLQAGTDQEQLALLNEASTSTQPKVTDPEGPRTILRRLQNLEFSAGDILIPGLVSDRKEAICGYNFYIHQPRHGHQDWYINGMSVWTPEGGCEDKSLYQLGLGKPGAVEQIASLNWDKSSKQKMMVVTKYKTNEEFFRIVQPKKGAHKFAILPPGSTDVSQALWTFGHEHDDTFGEDYAHHYEITTASGNKVYYMRCGTGCAMFPSEDRQTKKKQMAHTGYLNGQGHKEIPKGEKNTITKVTGHEGDNALFLAVTSMELHKYYTTTYKDDGFF